ncbi:MAG: radical SAM protein [Bacteroidales bacterium]
MQPLTEEKLGHFLKTNYENYNYNQTSMGLILTDKCPVACRHCISDNSVCSGETINLATLKKRISKIKELGNYKYLVITGGEPFFEFDKLLKVVNFSDNYNLKTSVVTSAYWARSKKQANEIVSLLSNEGLKGIALSVDYFHQEKIDIKNIVNVLEACKLFNLPCTIIFTQTGKPEKDLEVSEKLLKTVPLTLKNSLKISVGSILNSGRAYLNHLGPFYSENKSNEPLKCISMGKIIRSDGRIALCCGASLPLDSPLIAGDIDNEDAGELKTSLTDNFLIPFIEIFGLRWMAREIEKEFALKYFDFNEFKIENRCNICFKILSDRKLYDYFNHLIQIEEVQEMIRSNYLLLYGYDWKFNKT